MIALIPAFFRRTIPLLFLFISFTAQAGIQSVELIYQKTDIFKGNDALFALKVTKTSGKVYKSTDEYPKYPCVDFTYEVSKWVSITGPSQKHFRLKIPKYFEEEFIRLDIKLNYASSDRIFKFKIPVYNAADHVKSLHLYMDPNDISNDKFLPYKIFADLEENNGMEIQNRKIAFDEIKISVLKGGRFDAMNARIIPKQSNICDSLLVVRVALRSRPEIFTDEVYSIKQKAQNLSFSGSNGRKGRDGSFDSHGRNGLVGINGHSAENLTLFMQLGAHPCTQDTVLILSNKLKGSNQLVLYFPRNTVKVNLDAQGGNGGHGGTGQDGAYGKTGWTGVGLGGNGGDGGDGGNAGNGGNGGDGSSVKIIFTSETKKYISKITINVNGGSAGKAGFYGRYGKKGLAGTGTMGNGVAGRNGYNGRDGEPGTAGQDGKIEFIPYSDYMENSIELTFR
ncbi:MAG: hypothetical protein ACI8ZM_004412 [Crocinitomix sp.]|jgi:hypothetical protein